jgi:hypothetical protein
MHYIPIILISLSIILLIRVFRMQILKWLLSLRAKLQVHSLRTAISDADQDKEVTNRKNIVVFNQYTGSYEPVQKRFLKYKSQKEKNRNNAKLTEGRKRMMRKKSKRSFSMDRVKQIEEKSLYVTK